MPWYIQRWNNHPLHFNSNSLEDGKKTMYWDRGLLKGWWHIQKGNLNNILKVVGMEKMREGRGEIWQGRVESNQWRVDVGPYTKLILPFYLFFPTLAGPCIFSHSNHKEEAENHKAGNFVKKASSGLSSVGITYQSSFFSISYSHSSMIIVHSEDPEWKRLHVSLRM